MNELQAWKRIREAFLEKKKKVLNNTYSQVEDESLAVNGICYAMKRLYWNKHFDFDMLMRMNDKIQNKLRKNSNGDKYNYLTGSISQYNEIVGLDCRLKFLDEVISSLINEGKGKD